MDKESCFTFTYDGQCFLELDLKNNTYDYHGTLDEVASKFWQTMHEARRRLCQVRAIDPYKINSIHMCTDGHSRIEVFVDSGRIYHEIYNPEMSYLLGQLEERFQ